MRLAFFSTPGTTEILIILLVALLVFGGRLPEVGRSLGRALSEFRKGLHDLKREVEEEPRPLPPRARTYPPAPEGGTAGTSETAKPAGDAPTK